MRHVDSFSWRERRNRELNRIDAFVEAWIRYWHAMGARTL